MGSNTQREFVKDFYGKAAVKPQVDLCCPSNYPETDTSHIPDQVLERFYGCGSPVTLADIKIGETLVDLGSGAGIDCFIASKLTGFSGKVYGIDMTDEMLKIANTSKAKVIENLGYNNVEFKKGLLESIPLESNTVDVITSNCVINLSPDKDQVFSEMWRILKDHGRIAISDIICEIELPNYIKDNNQLWGECLAGALSENGLLSIIDKKGFYGTQITNKTYWRSIDNIPFYSITIKSYKYAKKSECSYIGQKAVYNGPFKVIIDDEGHVFPRNQEIEICSDTANKLSNEPYKGFFTIKNEEDQKLLNGNNCTTNGSGCC